MSSYRYRAPVRPFVEDRRAGPMDHWGNPVGTAYRVQCADGSVRTAYQTADADSFFTVPARVTVRGTTVTGSVYHRGNLDETGPMYRFAAYRYRKNAAMLDAATDGASISPIGTIRGDGESYPGI